MEILIRAGACTRRADCERVGTRLLFGETRPQPVDGQLVGIRAGALLQVHDQEQRARGSRQGEGRAAEDAGPVDVDGRGVRLAQVDPEFGDVLAPRAEVGEL